MFGLTYLGDKSFNIPLEEKSANESLKKLVLNSLEDSIEECIL